MNLRLRSVPLQGVICPFCRDVPKGASGLVSCSACQSVHHQKCWQQNQGCSVFGCSGLPLPIDTKNDIAFLFRWVLYIPLIVGLTILITTVLQLDSLGSEKVLMSLFAIYAIGWARFARQTGR